MPSLRAMKSRVLPPPLHSLKQFQTFLDKLTRNCVGFSPLWIGHGPLSVSPLLLKRSSKLYRPRTCSMVMPDLTALKSMNLFLDMVSPVYGCEEQSRFTKVNRIWGNRIAALRNAGDVENCRKRQVGR